MKPFYYSLVAILVNEAPYGPKIGAIDIEIGTAPRNPAAAHTPVAFLDKASLTRKPPNPNPRNGEKSPFLGLSCHSRISLNCFQNTLLSDVRYGPGTESRCETAASPSNPS
jgi:hypothetical protein